VLIRVDLRLLLSKSCGISSQPPLPGMNSRNTCIGAQEFLNIRVRQEKFSRPALAWPATTLAQHQGLFRQQQPKVATCPELGTVSQGATIEDALANLREATELYLEEFPLPDVGRPLLTTFEATYA
jgi:hypothetical protein